MRRPAGAHIVFRVHFEKTDRLGGGENVWEMRRLESDAVPRWKM